MENYRKGFPFSVFLSGAYRLHLILWYKFYHLHNIYRRVRQGELPEGQEKVPWGTTSAHRAIRLALNKNEKMENALPRGSFSIPTR